MSINWPGRIHTMTWFYDKPIPYELTPAGEVAIAAGDAEDEDVQPAA